MKRNMEGKKANTNPPLLMNDDDDDDAQSISTKQ